MEPTKKQLELLLILNPFEKKTAYREAANILGISKAAVQQRMLNLKKRCPDVYWKFRKLKKKLNKYQRNANRPYTINPKKIENLELNGRIREIW